MNRFVIALTLASSLALPAATVRGQESSEAESGRQQQRQQGQQQSQQRQRQQAQDRQTQQEQQEQQRPKSPSQLDQQSQQSQQSQVPRNVMLHGTIVDMDTIDLQGHGYQHVFATVRSDYSGRTFVVDLGTRNELQRLSIEPGQKIAITGQIGPFRDTQLIVAQEAQQGDRSASIRRGQGDAWSQFTQQQQQQMHDCPLCAAKADRPCVTPPRS